MLSRYHAVLSSTQIQRWLVGSVAVTLLVLSAGTVSAESYSGNQWIEMMAESGEMLNYSGRFVVSRNGEMSTLKISHMGSDMGGVQKPSSVDGQMREIVSSKDAVSCLLPDLNMGVKEARQSTVDQYFPMNFNGNMTLLNDNYIIELQSMARIADRDCQALAVKPKDQLRYGYVFCIDVENFLLLSSDLINEQGSVLESYRFVEIAFDKVQEQSLMPEVKSEELNWMDDAGTPHSNAGMETSNWVMKTNESNFVINHSLTRYSPALDSQIHHIILTDGLANVSAFVVPENSSSGDAVKDISMGALNANTKMVGGYKLTVLGEVPKSTVRLIANSMEIQP
jgi:sigma-E factor negative regulatory protein RseB